MSFDGMYEGLTEEELIDEKYRLEELHENGEFQSNELWELQCEFNKRGIEWRD